MILNIFLVQDALISDKNIMVAILGYIVVFAALVLLVLVFTSLPKVLAYVQRFRRKKGEAPPVKTEQIPAEVTAAIAMAIYLMYDESHDDESTAVTIKRISRNYSPWSSKIYGLDHYNRIKG